MIGSNRFRRFRRALGVVLAVVLAVVFLSLMPSCLTVPETERKQFNLLSEDVEIQMGADAYKQTLEKAPISTDPATNNLVRRVGMRIAQASGRSDYKWEFTVIQDDKTVNAFALPGGKVAVYTGILKVTQNEAGLAAVIGHEVAHATARHGGERITRSMITELALKGGEALLEAKFGQKDPETVKLVMAGFGLGAQLGIQLPFDRGQESEADEIGLLYMARAGYDPAESIEFWKRMAALSQGNTTPEFLSTHPSHESRVENLKKWLPRAKEEYEKSPLREKGPD